MVADDVILTDQEGVDVQGGPAEREEHSRGSTSRRSRWTGGEPVRVPAGGAIRIRAAGQY